MQIGKCQFCEHPRTHLRWTQRWEMWLCKTCRTEMGRAVGSESSKGAIMKPSPEYAEHAAPEAILAQLKLAKSARTRADNLVKWLSDLLIRRIAQVEKGEWPPKRV